MRGLSKSELAKVKNWDNIKLLDVLEGYYDRKVIIDMQNTSGIANKSVADPDVQGLYDTYNVLRNEAKERLNNDLSSIIKLDQLLEASSVIVLGFAKGALGIPTDIKSDVQVKQAKTDFNIYRQEIENLLT